MFFSYSGSFNINPPSYSWSSDASTSLSRFYYISNMTLDSSLLLEDVMVQVKRLMEKRGFVNPEIKFSSGFDIGDGYMEVANAISLKDDEKELEIFLKVACTNETLRESLRTRCFIFPRNFLLRQRVPHNIPILLWQNWRIVEACSRIVPHVRWRKERDDFHREFERKPFYVARQGRC